jgi:hypothetical protein
MSKQDAIKTNPVPPSACKHKRCRTHYQPNGRTMVCHACGFTTPVGTLQDNYIALGRTIKPRITQKEFENAIIKGVNLIEFMVDFKEGMDHFLSSGAYLDMKALVSKINAGVKK